MKRRLFYLLMSAVMITSIGINSYASDTEIGEYDTYYTNDNAVKVPTTRGTSIDNTGVIPGILESEEQQLAAARAAGNQEAIDKLTQIGDENEITPRATTWKYLSGLKVFKQLEEYYCVPAAVRSSINYITGRADNQANIAKDLKTTKNGTKFTNAMDYLNKKQSRTTYVLKNKDTTLSTMRANFYAAIHTFDAPPLLCARLSKTKDWPYTSLSHVVVITGARSDKNAFRIGDPYMKRINPQNSSFYSINASNIHYSIRDGYIF